MQAKIKAIQDRYTKFQNYQIKVSSDVTLYSDLKTQLLYKDFPELLATLSEIQIRLQQHEIVKGVLTWWSYECGHTVDKKYTEQCPVCELRKTREALKKIITYYNIPQNDLKNHVGDMMCQIARVALGQEAEGNEITKATSELDNV